MACSVYGAQYLLEALFTAGRPGPAIALMSARTKRSWWHMIDLGSTLTLEAWDSEYKKNLTWNHAWGAAPANIISRFLLGVRPSKPGYAEVLISPQLGALSWVRGQVPTPLGPVKVAVKNGATYELEISVPPEAKTRVVVPRRPHGELVVDEKPALGRAEGENWVIDFPSAGAHRIQSR